MAVTCLVVFKLLLLPIRVTGGSMLPAYRDGRVNLVNRLAYLRHEPQRGDVVGIRLAGVSVMYMKRIIGLPGETVAFAEGHAVIDGSVLDEPYVKFPCDWDREPVKLDSDQYFVVGDNRSMPLTNHVHGVLLRNRIVGKVIL
jgi:signal peptidase I